MVPPILCYSLNATLENSIGAHSVSFDREPGAFSAKHCGVSCFRLDTANKLHQNYVRKKKYDLCFLTKKKKYVRNNFAYGKITELSNNDKNYILTKQLRFMLLSNLCLNQILKLCVYKNEENKFECVIVS